MENQKLAGSEFSAVFKPKTQLIPFSNYQNVEKQATISTLEGQHRVYAHLVYKPVNSRATSALIDAYSRPLNRR
jgi:hypothetical protein